MSSSIDNQQIHQSAIFSSHSRKRSSPHSVPPTRESYTAASPMHSEKSIMSQRSRLVKAGLIIAGVFLFLLYLVPSRHSVPNVSGVSDTTDASTTTCTKPYDPSKPLRQYVLMIDAGSTGSRIHVYRFNNCGPTPVLEDEVFKMTPKKEGGSGLSSYKKDAEGAAKSLDVLMDVAMASVPDEYKSCTPVSVKATAGLRLLGEEDSKNILQAVRHRLETVYPFPVVSEEKGGVEILDGSDEGVYAWITTNYLLGKIGGPDESPTAAIFDLGGASTQIVFEPTFDSPSGGMPEKLAPGDHKYELQFGGRQFDLYQHSHLKYGLMEARAAVHRSIIEAKLAKSTTDLSWLDRPISNPCIGPGMQRQVNLTFPEGHDLAPEISVTMVGPTELSAPAQCRGITEKILHKEAECKLAPCSFNGIYQPSLEKTFAKEDVYIFSYFYDRTKPLGMPDSFTLHELQRLTEIVCGGKDNWGIFEGIEGAMEELEGRPESCLDLNFMLGLLHTGYEMPLSREVKIAKKIKDNELGWCLGASLPLLSQESGWTCRIKEVS